MFEIIGASALKDMIGMLNKNKDFFVLDSSKRKDLLSKELSNYPAAFQDYLLKASESEFIADAGLVAQVAKGLTRPQESKLLDAIAAFTSEVVGLSLDKLNAEFFFFEREKRAAHLDKLFKGKSHLIEGLKALFIDSTYQELTAMATKSLSNLKESPVIVVQTPLELPEEERVKIRTAFNEKHPFSFTEFQVNPQIIGGIRIFVNGRVADHSWLAKIQAITAINL